MKKQILLTIALLAFPLMSAFSQEWGQPKPQISVSGSAEVKVVPDEIYLNVGIETRDKDLQVAKKQNDDCVSGALDFLKHNDVKEKDVKTDYISIQPVYLRDNEAYIDSNTGLPVANRDNGVLSTKPLYYVVRKSIGIKLTNIESFDGVLSGLITNGVNIVQGIDFRTSELRKYRDKARAMAIQAAKEKAEAMASELGVKLGKANSVNENDWGGWSSWSRNGWGQGGGGGGGMYQNGSQNGGGATGSEEGTLSVGQISVSANVNVTFLIE
jgi:uncharacterized protein YggE